MIPKNDKQSGFTLVEALVAIVVLVFGLIAVTNLFLVGGTSNQAANHSTAAATQATEVLEALKAIPFNTLACGGQLIGADDPPPGAPCQPDCNGAPDTCPVQCVAAGNFNYYREVPGVGTILTTWTIANPIGGAAGPPVRYIVGQSESLAPLVGRRRSQAQFTTFRSCTTQGCSNPNPLCP